MIITGMELVFIGVVLGLVGIAVIGIGLVHNSTAIIIGIFIVIFAMGSLYLAESERTTRMELGHYAEMDLDYYMINNTNSTEILAEINSICTNLVPRGVDYSRCQQELVQEYLKYRR